MCRTLVFFLQSIEDKEKKRDLKRAVSVASSNENDDIIEFEAQKQEAEERQSGNLKWSVVTAYFRSGGNICFIAFTISMILIAAVATGATDYWISFW